MTHADMIKRYCPLTGNRCLGRECAKCEVAGDCGHFEPVFSLAELKSQRLSLTEFQKKARTCQYSVCCDTCEHQQLKCGL